MKTAAILLAAGASSRMGGTDKLLREIEGEPLLRRSARAALASSASEVLVVLPPAGARRADALAVLQLRRVIAPDAASGIAASLRAGIAAVAPDVEAALIALADLPGLTRFHYDAVIAAATADHEGAPCRAADESGRAGHPVLLPRALFAEVAQLTGDAGALSQGGTARLVATPGFGATRDLDTPADWAEWERGLD